MLKLLDDFTLRQTNPSKDEAIIFIHGNSHSSKTWSPTLLKALSHYNCITYDLIGHGDATESTHYDMELFTNQLKSITNSISQKTYHLVGQSLGGHIAIHSLQILENKPRSIFCFGTPPLEKPLESSPYNEVAQMGLLVNERLTLEQAKSLSKSFYNKIDLTSTTQLQDILKTDPLFRASFLPGIMAGAYHDEIEILKKSQIKHLLLFGEKDSLIDINYIKKNLKLFNYKLLKNLGHNLHQEDEVLLLQELKSFIKKE